MTKTRIAGLLVALTLLLGGAIGCSNPPTTGTIARKFYRPEHYNDWVSFHNGACISYTTTRSGNTSIQTCTAYQQIPIYHHDYIPARWQFLLTADPGDTKHDHSGWQDVDQITYNKYEVGDHYPDPR